MLLIDSRHNDSAPATAQELDICRAWETALVKPELRRGEFGARIVLPDASSRYLEFEGLSPAICSSELRRAHAAFGAERFERTDRLELWNGAIERLLRFVDRSIGQSLRMAVDGADRIAWLTGNSLLDRLPTGFVLADTSSVFRVPSLDWLSVASPGRRGSVRLAAQPFTDPDLPAGGLEADLVRRIAPIGSEGVAGYHVIRHGADAQRLHEDLAEQPGHVVLSGCSTAIDLPDVRPGSSRCGSLWPIDTTLAPAFMAAYYARLADGDDAVDALRGAQQAHIGASPIVAAAFVHDGEPA